MHDIYKFCNNKNELMFKWYYVHLTVYRCLSQPLFIFGVFTSYTLIFVNAASTYYNNIPEREK